MCTGVEVALIAGAAATTYGALTAKQPGMPDPLAPEKPPQAAKTPDPSIKRQKNANATLEGPMAGNASTLLTGPSGIDSSLLNLGHNKLFGE